MVEVVGLVGLQYRAGCVGGVVMGGDVVGMVVVVGLVGLQYRAGCGGGVVMGGAVVVMVGWLWWCGWWGWWGCNNGLVVVVVLLWGALW